MEFTKSKIFLISICFFILGIFIASVLPIEIAGKSVFWFIGMVLFGVLCFLLFNFQNKNFLMVLIALWAIFLFFGIWRYSISIPRQEQNKIWNYNNKVITFVGTVNKEPDIRATNQKLEIESEKIFFNDGEKDVSGKALVTTNLYPRINYGDRLKIKCQLQQAEEFNGFAYDRYLARYNIYSVCYWPEIEFLEAGQGNKIYSLIFSFKNKLREKINKNLGLNESALARAILLGDKKALSNNWQEIFSRIGLSHIVAISGMHISILSGLIMFLFLSFGLKRGYSFYLATLFLIVYILLIGAPASAMRAGIMAFLLLLAIHLGRLNKTVNALALAGLILLLINPRLLYDDIGFQLSFLAVLGISWFYPLGKDWVEQKGFKIPEIIIDIILITISAQIFTWPIIAINFSQISFISIISNLLIVWILPFLISGIIVALIISFIIPFLAPIFFGLISLIANYIFEIASFLSKVPGGFVEVDSIPIIILIFYYCFIIFIFFRFSNQLNLQK